MNSYTDTTGVLIFNGAPNALGMPLLQKWLSEVVDFEYGLVPEEDDVPPNSMLVRELAEVTEMACPSDDGFIAAALEALRLNGCDVTQADRWEVEEVLSRLGESFDCRTLMNELSEQIDDPLSLDQLIRVAMTCTPGANIKGAMLQTGYHADKARLWAFGGYTTMVFRDRSGSPQVVEFSPRAQMKAAFKTIEDQDVNYIASEVGTLAAQVVRHDSWLMALNLDSAIRAGTTGQWDRQEEKARVATDSDAPQLPRETA